MQKIVWLFTVCLSLLSFSAVSESSNWFERGERIHYLIEMWGWLDVGEAEILFQPKEDSYTILARAWTDSKAFKLRDRLTTHGVHSERKEEGPFYSTMQRIELNENDYKGHKTVTFERPESMVRYHNIQGKEAPIGFRAPEHVRDMISALYYYRKTLKDVKVGDSFTHDVAQNDFVYRMTLNVVAKEKRKGKRLIKVKPIMQKMDREGQPFKDPSDTWSIWVSDDENLIPQRIEAKTKFGSFVATLKHYGPPSDGSRVIDAIPETGEISMK